MAIDAIDPIYDPRISHCKADVNGKTYNYLLGIPNEEFQDTIILVHGWPDISMGWRNQIPMLLQLGFRVVCPDIMGFGGTDAPMVPPESMSYYGFKRVADDIKELAKQLGSSRVILGGHDWGGAIVYRVALWYPDFVTHIFSICTPYLGPSKYFISLEDMVKTILPNFGYQLQLASGEIEKAIVSKEQIRQFLNGMYGGKGPNGEIAMKVQEGVQIQNLPKLGPTPLVSPKMLDYYADQYAQNGMHGTLNWYRNREVNYQEELQLEVSTIDVPVLFVQATKDAALPPALSVGMEKTLSKLTRKEVPTGHWALWEAPDQVNKIIKEWLEANVLGYKSAL